MNRRELAYSMQKLWDRMRHTCDLPAHLEWQFDYYGNRRGYETNGERRAIY